MPAQQHGPLQGLRLGGNPFPIPHSPVHFWITALGIANQGGLPFLVCKGWSAVDRGVDYDVVLSMCLKCPGGGGLLTFSTQKLIIAIFALPICKSTHTHIPKIESTDLLLT
jgi:hypothetical protein